MSGCLRWLEWSAAVIALGCAWPPSAATAQCQYEVTIIQPDTCGFPEGIPTSHGLAVNELGHVAGYYDRCYPEHLNHEAFIWTPESGLQTIERPPGMTSVQVLDMNESGELVGWSVTDRGHQAFIWSDGQFTLLDTIPGGNWGEANAINDGGAIVGWGNDAIDGIPGQEAVLWRRGAMIRLAPLFTEKSSVAHDINNHGDVAASQRTVGVSSSHAVLLADGELIVIGNLPNGNNSMALAVNDLGQVAGRSRIPNGADGQSPWHSFFWSDGEMSDLGLLAGKEETFANAMNDRGQIVGYALPDLCAFIWHEGAIHNLNDLIGQTPVSLSIAYDINNKGQICGRGGVDGESMTFLLTPIPVVGDVDGDCAVDAADLAIVLAQWGPCDRQSCEADLNDDGVVGPEDLAHVLGNWG